MIDQLIEWDREIFLFLNGQHSEATDLFMYALTNTWAWIPLYILLLYWIWKYYGSNSWIFLHLSFEIIKAPSDPNALWSLVR